jgi:cysteine sulfinate desulfinase/cysteine desulfurase-like protein
MGVDADRSLRASVGWPSTDADVEQFATAFPIVMEQLRALRNPVEQARIEHAQMEHGG